MKKTNLTRSLMAAVSIVALSAVMYGCVHSGDETEPPVTEPAPDPVADLNAAIAAEAAARTAIAALSVTSTDAEVADANTKLSAAQAAVMKLAEGHALRTSVAGLATSLQGIETARTVASQLETVNDAHDMAKMAVDALDRAASTADAVAAARALVKAAQDALTAATALSEDQRTSLGSMIMAVNTALTAIETYRATDAGMLAVAEAAVDAAEALVDALTDESPPAEAGAAYAALQRAKQAVAAAENLPDNVKARLSAKIKELEDQAKGQSSITLALAEATTAVNSLTDDSTDADVTAARTAVNAAKTAAEDLPDDDARKMAIAALDTNLMGIEQARIDEGNKPGLDANAKALVAAIEGAALPTSTDAPAISAMGMPPTTGDNKFAASTMSIDSIDGWMGNAYMRMNKAKPIDRSTDPDTAAVPASDDTVVVYNNKGDDEEVSYVDHFAGLATPRTVTAATGALAVGKNDDDVITDTVTVGGSGSQRTIAASGSDGDELDGTFHGLRGKFTCASGCTINVLANGKFEVDADDLTFTPTLDTSDGADPAATQVANLTIMIPDPDYLHFGYWKNASMNSKGEPVYTVTAFSGGTDASVIATVQSLEGSAKYAGSATGLYVRKEVDSGGDPQHLYHGQFTADANLTASFGGTSVAADDHYSIKGMITNFMDGDDAIDSTWSVTLEKTGFDVTGNTNAGAFDATNANMFTGGATEGDKGMAGSWSGQFFGTVEDNDETADPPGVDVHPSGVAGEFNGHFVNGHVLGAFGADIVEE